MEPDTVVSLWRPNDPESFWTMVAAIVSILVLGAAIWGLTSLRLTRIDMRNRALREARQSAIDRARDMVEKLIPMSVPVTKALSELKLPPIVAKAADVSFNTDAEQAILPEAKKWVARLASNPQYYTACIDMLNEMEAWAMHFTQGLADPDLVARNCAPLFNWKVIQLYPLIVKIRADENAGDFPNIVELFEDWFGERLREKHLAEAQALLDSVAERQKRDYNKRPIGLE